MKCIKYYVILLILLSCSYEPTQNNKINKELNVKDSLNSELIMLKNQAFCDCYNRSIKKSGVQIAPHDGSSYLQLSDLVVEYTFDPILNNPDTDMILDGNFWTNIYAQKTGHTVVWKNSNFQDSISKLKDTLSEGGVVTLSLTAQHSVVVESITTKYTNGDFKSMTIRIMDPGIGTFRSLNFDNKHGSSFVTKFQNQIGNMFYIKK